MRRANIGLYTDRMVLSVQESVQEGSYCLLRRQVQEDFLNEQGSLDVDKTVQAAEGLAQLAQQLFCSSTTMTVAVEPLTMPQMSPTTSLQKELTWLAFFNRRMASLPPFSLWAAIE